MLPIAVDTFVSYIDLIKMKRKPAARAKQGTLEFRTWGGRRKGAGRPRTKARAGVPHRARARVKGSEPQHVTIRLVREIARLRTRKLYGVIVHAIAKAQRETFTVGAWTIQDGHLHLVTEADSWRALSNGMRALEIRIARAINRALSRVGRVFDDRYHARALSTPREVRNALVYVLQNARKHFEQRGFALGREWLDRFSSAPWFDGWNATTAAAAGQLRRTAETTLALRTAPVALPRTWLLSVGWRRHGLIAASETPRT